MLHNTEIDRLNNLIRSKNDEVERLNLKIKELELKGETIITEKLTYLTSEVDVWK